VSDRASVRGEVGVQRHVLLVRHCEATAQHAEAPLSDVGVAQARALAHRQAPLRPDHLVSSPYRRAQQSIAPLAAQLGLAVAIDPRLRERRLGDEPIGDWRGAVRASFDDLERALPGGESGRAAQTRARSAVLDALAAGHRLPLLATHGNWLALLLTSIDGRFGYAGWESLRNPDVFLLTAAGEAWSYERLA
jgi:2,3-bisphosphoglycerate-dependent phosphoglycerate mutase